MYKYKLRSKVFLGIPPAYTIDYGINSVHFRACRLWNFLPTKIKLCKQLDFFRKLDFFKAEIKS